MIFDETDFFDEGVKINRFIKTPCGSPAEFDYDSGMGYRCTHCNAMIGSIGMPNDCYEIMKTNQEKEKIWEILKK